MADFIADLSVDIPWHLSAYHQDYKMENRNTNLFDLERAAEIGKKAGLNYIYIGNVYHGNKWRDTHCPDCSTLLVKREGYRLKSYNLKDGNCPKCDKTIPGLWEDPISRLELL